MRTESEEKAGRTIWGFCPGLLQPITLPILESGREQQHTVIAGIRKRYCFKSGKTIYYSYRELYVQESMNEREVGYGQDDKHRASGF